MPSNPSASFDLALILPCYNYGSRLRTSLDKIEAWRKESGLKLFLCIVDDGSTDDTARVAENFCAERKDWCVLHRCMENRGKGNAVREGTQKIPAGAAEYIFFTDSDLYYGLSVIRDRMLPALHQGADVVIVDRSWQRQFHAESLLRKILSYVFSHLKTILASVPYQDTQAGIKGFRADFLRPAVGVARVDGFSFDVELLSLALQYHRQVERIPVAFKGEAAKTGSTMDARKALRMFWDLWRIGFYRFSGRYQSSQLVARVTGRVYEIHH